MAHWAKIDENNIVERVIVTSNDAEDEGESFVNDVYGGRWIKTSYNTRGGVHILGGTPLRKNFAMVGGTYDEHLDAFMPPRPSENHLLDEETCLWIDPNEPKDEASSSGPKLIEELPAPRPEDATWLPGYEPEPEGLIDMPNKRVYIWLDKYSEWGLLSSEDNPPPSDGQYYSWNPLTRSWEQPDSDIPGENFYWDALEKTWIEFPVDNSGYEVS